MILPNKFRDNNSPPPTLYQPQYSNMFLCTILLLTLKFTIISLYTVLNFISIHPYCPPFGQRHPTTYLIKFYGLFFIVDGGTLISSVRNKESRKRHLWSYFKLLSKIIKNKSPWSKTKRRPWHHGHAQTYDVCRANHVTVIANARSQFQPTPLSCFKQLKRFKRLWNFFGGEF